MTDLEPSSNVAADRSRTLSRFFSRTSVLLLVMTVLALMIRLFVAEQFYVSGSSMLGTLREPDRVLVEKLTGRFGEFRRGDVVVFTMHFDDASRELVKRVVGLPGEHVEVRGCQVLIDGSPLSEPYLDPGNQQDCRVPSVGSVTLAGDELFVLGDNRDNSSDSRVFGPVHLEQVVGRAMAVFWPPSHWRSL